ncbi:MAG TPA: type II secretion system F family protein [Candidatus Absconditabacterales bacterium]|nr:type II secretion system F family protein [Candidatus Absconditabacterales bacterium]
MAVKEVFKSDFFEKLVIKLNAPKLKNKTNFFRLLAVSQKAGLGIVDSLNSLKKSEQNRGLRIIIEDLIFQLEQGVSLADAMQNHDYFFSIGEIELVRSSQVTGNMISTLYDIADELENSEKIRQKIKKALTYPLMLVGISVIAVVLLLMFAIPSIVSIFPEDGIPSITVFMMDVSAFLQKSRYVLFILLIGLVLLYKFLYSNVLPFKIFIDKMAVRLPVVGGVVKYNYMYKFSRLLGQFYSAGINPVVSLQLISNIFKNFEYKKKVIEIKKDLETGFTFFESMEGTSLFDPILVQIIHVGEDTGTTNEVLNKISGFYKEQLQTKIDILMSFLEPFLMIFIAGMIGIIVASVFIPMASIVTAI